MDFQQIVLEQLDIHLEKTDLDPNIKINFKWIIDPNIKTKTKGKKPKLSKFTTAIYVYPFLDTVSQSGIVRNDQVTQSFIFYPQETKLHNYGYILTHI